MQQRLRSECVSPVNTRKDPPLAHVVRDLQNVHPFPARKKGTVEVTCWAPASRFQTQYTCRAPVETPDQDLGSVSSI